MTAPSRFRIAFCGTPSFALPCLETLFTIPSIEVVTCITQPDRPIGRKKIFTPSVVKRRAVAAGLPILQPDNLRSPNTLRTLQGYHLDAVVLVAYGKIITPDALAIPRCGWVNVHASLLPRWRGASPVAHAILAGDSETGVTIIKLNAGLDTGPILASRPLDIEPTDTTGVLTEKLAIIGAELLKQTLPEYLEGFRKPIPQTDVGVTAAPKLDRANGIISWNESARSIDRMVRAFTPWPGTTTIMNGKVLKILAGRPLHRSPSGKPGAVVDTTNGIITVSCGDGSYVIEKLQLQDREPLSATAFLHGHPNLKGVTFG